MNVGRLKIKQEEPMKEDIYTDEGLFQKAEDDSISGYEEAFMKGYCLYCD